MARRVRRGLLAGPAAAVWLVAPAAPARAADDPGGDDGKAVHGELRRMRQELDRLREDNQRMHTEIDQLRAENSEDWLTEARAEEIRGLVADVLADADVRASHLTGGLTAGWNEHFFLASPDGRFKFQLDGLIQSRFAWRFRDFPDRHRYGFEVTRARLTFRGHVFNPNITWLIRTDKTRDDPGLVEGLYLTRDAWIGLQFDNNWSMRLGLFKVPFNREQLVSVAYQLAVERSLINQNANLDRSEGIEITWANATDKISFMTSDGGTDNLGGFMVVGGRPANTSFLTQDVEFAFHARWEHLIAGEWKQFADFTSPMEDQFGALIGLAAHWQKSESDGLRSQRRNETRWFAATGDLSLEFGGANLFFSGIYHYVDQMNFIAQVFGVVVQGGVYVAPKVELFGRWEYGHWDIPSSVANFEDLSVVTLGVNYYLDGHDLKWTTDIGFGTNIVDQPFDSDIAGFEVDPPDANPQVVFRTQFQLLF